MRPIANIVPVVKLTLEMFQTNELILPPRAFLLRALEERSFQDHRTKAKNSCLSLY